MPTSLEAEREEAEAKENADAEPSIEELLTVDRLGIEIGYRLISLVESRAPRWAPRAHPRRPPSVRVQRGHADPTDPGEGQHPDRPQRVSDLAQRRVRRARRAPRQPISRDGPGRQRNSAGRPGDRHGRAGVRPARALDRDRREGARRTAGLHGHRRPVGSRHPPHRSAQRRRPRTALARRREGAGSTTSRRPRRPWSTS